MGKPWILQHARVVVRMVAQPGREKPVDLLVRIVHAPRPGNAENVTESVHNRMRLGKKPIIAEVCTPQIARVGLCAEDMLQPHEMSDGPINPIAGFQRLGNVHGVADRGNDQRPSVEAFEHFNPERQQAAYPGILDDEQRAVAEFALKCCSCAPAKPVGDG